MRARTGNAVTHIDTPMNRTKMPCGTLAGEKRG
jgi:hypothetical protein